MHKSILVLEESRMVHELFESALPEDYISWEVNHESTPDKYFKKAEETNPDIIFLSNQDKDRNYKTVKRFKSSPEFSHTPILLLTSAKDTLDESHLQSIGVRGFVRKPFETSTLQKQINVVLKEQEDQKADKKKDRLKDLNVVDDDLMDLLGGQEKPEVSLDELEEELDPTLQLIPEDADEDEETEETELLAMDDSDDLDQAEFIEDDVDSNLNLDADSDLDLEDDIELEELDDESDFMDLDDDRMTLADFETDNQYIRTIQIVEGDSAELREPLLNVPEDSNDLGFMELHVVPLRDEEIKSNVLETITDDFDEEEFVKKHAPVELEDDFMSADSEIIMDITQDGDGGDIEIPHEEIIEDFHEGDDDLDLEAEDEEEGLLELSIEGMDGEFSSEAPDNKPEEAAVAFEEFDDAKNSIEEINIPDPDLSEDTDEVELASLDADLSDEGELAPVTQEEDIDFSAADEEDDLDMETDLHSGSLDEPQSIFNAFENEIDEENLTASELEKRRSDQLDIDLEEIAAAGSEEASATIQEMIGFRQVMKAKYDIPEDDLQVDDLAEGVTDEIGEDEDLFSAVEGSFSESDDEAGEILSDESDAVADSFKEMDVEEPELTAKMPSEEDSLSDDMGDDTEDTILTEPSDNDDQDIFTPLPEEFPTEDDATLLAELPDDEEVDEISSLMEAEPDSDEEDTLLAELPDQEEPDDLLMEELPEDDTALTEDIPESTDSSLMDDDKDKRDEDSTGDLLLDVDEPSMEDANDLDLLTNEIDEETDDELTLLTDELDTTETEEDNEQLDDIDLLSDMDEEIAAPLTDTKNGVFGAEPSGSAMEDSDDIFLESADLPMAKTLDDTTVEESDDIFANPDDEGESLVEPIGLPTDEDEEDTLLSDEPLEEIELLPEDTPLEDDSASLLQIEEDMEEEIEAVAIDQDDAEKDTLIAAPEDLLSDAEAEFDASAGSAMDDIDFLPIDEESDGDDLQLEVEIDDTATTDENVEFAEELSDDQSVDDIDFLPVDEEEASMPDKEEEIEDIPIVTLAEQDEDADSMVDIDFMPADPQTDLPDMAEEESDQKMDAITENDDVTIEVPQETFEMSDFNIEDITDDEDAAIKGDITEEENEEVDLMTGIDTVSSSEESETDDVQFTEESYDDIELPTMDEDLPDLPPISSDDEGLNEESLDDFDAPTTDDSDIQLMQEQSDFDDFDAEQEIIGLTEEPTSSVADISMSETEHVKQHAQQAAVSLTPEFRKKLSKMIEGVVSETVHNTLQEKLPELVDKLVDEEMEE